MRLPSWRSPGAFRIKGRSGERRWRTRAVVGPHRRSRVRHADRPHRRRPRQRTMADTAHPPDLRASRRAGRRGAVHSLDVKLQPTSRQLASDLIVSRHSAVSAPEVRSPTWETWRGGAVPGGWDAPRHVPLSVCSSGTIRTTRMWKTLTSRGPSLQVLHEEYATKHRIDDRAPIQPRRENVVNAAIDRAWRILSDVAAWDSQPATGRA
jgi:hypothetical protein